MFFFKPLLWHHLSHALWSHCHGRLLHFWINFLFLGLITWELSNRKKMISFVRRFINVILSSVTLILLLPLFLILIIIIKCSSSGPAFFRQVRVGKDYKVFQLLKFRTMMVNAEQKGPLVTARNDNRVTVVGKFLRHTKLDELPSLWNVLLGNMNLVGPRPEVTKYVELYSPEWCRVFDVRPGITDLATLQFRDEESVLDGVSDSEQAYIEVVVPIKIKLALEYVDKQSLWLDLKILIMTIWAITLGRFFVKPDRRLAEFAKETIETFKIHKT